VKKQPFHDLKITSVDRNIPIGCAHSRAKLLKGLLGLSGCHRSITKESDVTYILTLLGRQYALDVALLGRIHPAQQSSCTHEIPLPCLENAAFRIDDSNDTVSVAFVTLRTTQLDF
jgi:hypothetical protein